MPWKRIALGLLAICVASALFASCDSGEEASPKAQPKRLSRPEAQTPARPQDHQPDSTAPHTERVEIPQSPPGSDRDPAAPPVVDDTIAVYFEGASREIQASVMSALSSTPDFQYVTVGNTSQLFDYPGFVQVICKREYARYEVEETFGRDTVKRGVNVPNGVRMEISAFADWPSTWDQPVTIAENLITRDIHYQYYGDKTGISKDVAASMALQRRRAGNERQLAEGVASQLEKLPPFGRIAGKKGEAGGDGN